MKILEKLKTGRLFFDGGTGTVLQSLGLAPGEAPESWTLTHPDVIKSLHVSYLDAGADIVKTNTFGVNCVKYDDYEEYITRAVALAKEAVGKREDKYVAYDIGPTGRLLEPLGDLAFEDAVAIFAKGVKCAVKAGVDLILIETMNDLYETKAALLAAKECSDLPVFVTNAYDESSRLMTGAYPESVIALLEGMGADAIGLNCSFGPDRMAEIVKTYVARASVPVIVNPNAGLPSVKDGRTVYDLSAEDFAERTAELARAGAHIVGGCCGTDPEYIRRTVEKVKEIPYVYPEKKNHSVICAYTKALEIGERPLLIGERINPTGKKRLKEALRENDLSYVIGEGVRQAEAGAHILDVNVGLPEIDETSMMVKVVRELQEVTDLPLQIDTANRTAMERACRIYNGVPLINSVNGKEESMEAVLPVAAKYGGVVIALTLDGDGIPDTAQKRVQIAERIAARAEKYGIGKYRLVVDPLCLTVSSDRNAPRVTLEAVKELKSRGFFVSLGVSNVSFGLPSRDMINMTFFAEALENGLDLAIMNPFSKEMTDVYHAFTALNGYDTGFEEYIAYAEKSVPEKKSETPASAAFTLDRLIVRGMKKEAAELTSKLLETTDGLEIVNTLIIPALGEVGEAYESKRAYLPQLIMSAEAASASFDVIRASLPSGKADESRKFIIATVRGDVHDIGKNIVRVLLESYSFKVYDLGKDVPPEKVLECVKETGCRLVGLSALMTTTVPAMKETIELLHSYDPEIKVIVGGAVLNEEYARMINADAYGKEATDTVRYAEDYYER